MEQRMKDLAAMAELAAVVEPGDAQRFRNTLERVAARLEELAQTVRREIDRYDQAGQATRPVTAVAVAQAIIHEVNTEVANLQLDQLAMAAAELHAMQVLLGKVQPK